MTRVQELQATISKMVRDAYALGEQHARDGKDRHAHNPWEPHNPLIAQVYRIGHMDEVARQHFASTGIRMGA